MSVPEPIDPRRSAAAGPRSHIGSASTEPASEGSELERLVAVTALLRGPGGCPWDAAQTHASLVRYLIEETYELVEAIETGTRDDLLEELGDVLYQVLFHAEIASHTPAEDFDVQDVAAHMTAKMIGRHPHVFGSLVAETPEAVTAVWDDLKRREKPSRTSVLDGIPRAMPALALAEKLLGRAEKVGVVPAPSAGAAPAVPLVSGSEPALGPGSASPGESTPRDEGELGQLLLRIVQEAVEQGLDAERALRGALRGLEEEIRTAEAAAGGR